MHDPFHSHQQLSCGVTTILPKVKAHLFKMPLVWLILPTTKVAVRVSRLWNVGYFLLNILFKGC